MRTEAEVIANVLAVAEEDEMVRGVVRTNLLPVRAYTFIYEFYFIVADMGKYEEDELYATCFGKRILLYRGDRNYPDILQGAKAHLMVFEDGITLVIKVITLEMFWERYRHLEKGDTFKKLLDKENILPDIDDCVSDKNIFSHRPTEEEFRDTCMEYFWVLKSFAEYIMREELPAAMFYLNVAVRDMLNKMLRWYLALKHDFAVDCGVLDSYFEKYLEPDLFEAYKKTYPIADYKALWEAFDAVVALYTTVGEKVGAYFGFEYPIKTQREILDIIENINRMN